MRIKELTLYTNKLAEQKHFFENIFGFTVHQLDTDSIYIEVGWTKFIFKQNNKESQLYHYCFLIPANKLHEAIQWVESKIDLINIQDNEKLVHYENWNAHSFYFYDGAGNIAECIVRYDLENRSDSPFDIADFLCVNEIGLGTNDIEKTNQQLESYIGTKFWKGNLKRFAANGDQEGLFLLPNYAIKDTWFPTEIIIKPNSLTAVIENENISYDFQFIDGNIITTVKSDLNKLEID